MSEHKQGGKWNCDKVLVSKRRARGETTRETSGTHGETSTGTSTKTSGETSRDKVQKSKGRQATTRPEPATCGDKRADTREDKLLLGAEREREGERDRERERERARETERGRGRE